MDMDIEEASGTKEGNTVLVILVGAPGSGKSFFCEEVMRSSTRPWVRVCQLMQVCVRAQNWIQTTFCCFLGTNVPFHICCFAWRLLRSRIAVKEELVRRNVIGEDSQEFVFCINNTESLNHLFIHCPFTNKVWTSIYKWLEAPNDQAISTEDTLRHHISSSPNKFVMSLWNIFWFATIWSIWTMCNDVIFGEGKISFTQLIHNVNVKSWLWFSNRSRNKTSFSCNNWCSLPIITKL